MTLPCHLSFFVNCSLLNLLCVCLVIWRCPIVGDLCTCYSTPRRPWSAYLLVQSVDSLFSSLLIDSFHICIPWCIILTMAYTYSSIYFFVFTTHCHIGDIVKVDNMNFTWLNTSWTGTLKSVKIRKVSKRRVLFPLTETETETNGFVLLKRKRKVKNNNRNRNTWLYETETEMV